MNSQGVIGFGNGRLQHEIIVTGRHRRRRLVFLSLEFSLKKRNLLLVFKSNNGEVGILSRGRSRFPILDLGQLSFQLADFLLQLFFGSLVSFKLGLKSEKSSFEIAHILDAAVKKFSHFRNIKKWLRRSGGVLFSIFRIVKSLISIVAIILRFHNH